MFNISCSCSTEKHVKTAASKKVSKQSYGLLILDVDTLKCNWHVQRLLLEPLPILDYRERMVTEDKSTTWLQKNMEVTSSYRSLDELQTFNIGTSIIRSVLFCNHTNTDYT